MYCGFIDDKIFRTKAAVDSADKVYGQCVIDSQIANYFCADTVVKDQRAERLQLGGRAVSGQLSFHYDGKQHADGDLFKSLSNENLKILFNIIEMIYLSNGAGVGELNSNLINSSLSKDVYVNNTLKLSPKSVQSTIPYIDGSTAETKITLQTYIEFDVMFAEHSQETIRLYTDRATFLAEYPISTINDVIFPCDAKFILDPTKITGTVEAVIKSTEFSLKSLDSNIAPEDHTGLLTYYTKYITKNKNGAYVTQMLPFGILYQGAKPTSLNIREAIRNKLLALGIAAQSIWESILPDLFVIAQFFIIPSWGNYTQRPEGTLYPSVINMEFLRALVPTLFPNFKEQFIKEHQEILVYGYGELFLTSIPDPLNKEMFSIREKHPTYLHHLEQDGTGFLNQTPTTRDFNQRLNRTMAVAAGAEIATVTTTQEIDGLTWHSFVNDHAEFHVLSQTSYDEVFNK